MQPADPIRQIWQYLHELRDHEDVSDFTRAYYALIADRLVDYVAMDIKSTLAKYSLAAGVPVRTDRITESIALLLRGDVDYEFRTTVLPDLLAPDDIPELAELLRGARRYYLQQFRADATLDPAWQAKVPYPIATLQEMAQALCTLGIPTEVRGG